MKTIQDSIDVAVPVRTAYDQWTQFASFPEFMSGVDKVEQLDDTRTHWTTEIGVVHREIDADITEQHPDERVAWRTVDGPHHAGVVTFHRLDERRTRVTLQMDYAPDSFVEKVGAALGVVGHQITNDLKRFKLFIESRGTPTGAWRGDVEAPPQVDGGPAGAAGTGPGAAPLG